MPSPSVRRKGSNGQLNLRIKRLSSKDSGYAGSAGGLPGHSVEVGDGESPARNSDILIFLEKYPLLLDYSPLPRNNIANLRDLSLNLMPEYCLSATVRTTTTQIAVDLKPSEDSQPVMATKEEPLPIAQEEPGIITKEEEDSQNQLTVSCLEEKTEDIQERGRSASASEIKVAEERDPPFLPQRSIFQKGFPRLKTTPIEKLPLVQMLEGSASTEKTEYQQTMQSMRVIVDDKSFLEPQKGKLQRKIDRRVNMILSQKQLHASPSEMKAIEKNIEKRNLLFQKQWYTFQQQFPFWKNTLSEKPSSAQVPEGDISTKRRKAVDLYHSRKVKRNDSPSETKVAEKSKILFSPQIPLLKEGFPTCSRTVVRRKATPQKKKKSITLKMKNEIERWKAEQMILRVDLRKFEEVRKFEEEIPHLS